MNEKAERMIGFVGVGNMGSAMIRSLVAGGRVRGSSITVINRGNLARVAALENECGVVRARDLADMASRCPTIVLAVKPDQVTEVAESLRTLLRSGSLVISVAAGISLEHLQRALGPAVVVVRAMPNTPARVGEGATALAAAETASAAHRAEAELILGAMGKVYWVEEEDLDIVTALSGSGPAYIFRFSQEMANAAARMGLDPALANSLARQTLIGAGALVKQSGANLEDLVRQVTSPGGTTAAALKVMTARGLGALVEEAMVKATFRSHEMSGLPERHVLTRARRVVVKIGSTLIAGADGVLNESVLAGLVDQISDLVGEGREVLIVSSGAIVAGRGRLGGELRGSITEKQALAAVGQSILMSAYRSLFERRGITVAQVLLTGEDFSHPRRSALCLNTLSTLLERGVVPIINENDTVAVDEIRLGDNDALSARVAVLVSADLLVLLTDTPGLYTGDPKTQPGAEPLKMIAGITPALLEMAKGGGGNGSGGMVTKLWAANVALEHGIPTVIAGGAQPEVLKQVLAGKEVGTFICNARPSEP